MAVLAGRVMMEIQMDLVQDVVCERALKAPGSEIFPTKEMYQSSHFIVTRSS